MICYVLPVLGITSCLLIVARISDLKRHILNVIQQGAA